MDKKKLFLNASVIAAGILVGFMTLFIVLFVFAYEDVKTRGHEIVSNKEFGNVCFKVTDNDVCMVPRVMNILVDKKLRLIVKLDDDRDFFAVEIYGESHKIAEMFYDSEKNGWKKVVFFDKEGAIVKDDFIRDILNGEEKGNIFTM